MTTEAQTRTNGSKAQRAAPRPIAERPAFPSTPPPPPLPTRRNPKWIALGVVAVCLGGLLSYLIYARVANATSVVAMAATVYRGDVVQVAHLKTVTLNGDPGVPTVSAGELNSLVGRRAAYDLVTGSLVPPGAITDGVVPGAKRALVGIKVAAGRAPAGFLVSSAPVRLVAVPPANAAPGFSDAYVGKTFAAKVVRTEPGPDAASVLVDVDVATEQAPVIAMLSAQDRLTVVRDADR